MILKKLKKSTVRQYTARKVAAHADRYQDKFNISLYRFDFSHEKIYKYENGNYMYCMSLSRWSSNKEAMIEALNEIYEMVSINE
jgi:hypothetical protein